MKASSKPNIGINEKDRKAIADCLGKLLADTYTLYLKTHCYHWNVTGPQFNSLHNMFELQYTEMSTAVDLIAERIRSLGYFAPGSYMEFGKLTSIKEQPQTLEANAMVKDLVASHEILISTARKAFPIIDKAGDEASADLVTQRLQLHEKTAWMLRSLLEK